MRELTTSGKGRARPESFGQRLRRLRSAQKLSLGELAHLAGVTEGAIRQMESGQTKTATLLVGIRLADALGVDVRYIALGDGEESGAKPLTDRFNAFERRLAAVERRLKLQ